MEYTKEERDAIMRRMRAASDTFYVLASGSGCHAFIEFTGLMNEYIKLCHEADEAGIPWVHANVHGDVHLPWKPWHIAYLSEKLECIYGRGLADGTQEQKGVQDCIDIVRQRQKHYECYREPGAMQTKPATFAVLDEMLIFLEAHLERVKDEHGGSTV